MMDMTVLSEVGEILPCHSGIMWPRIVIKQDMSHRLTVPVASWLTECAFHIIPNLGIDALVSLEKAEKDNANGGPPDTL